MILFNFEGEKCKMAVIADPHHFRIVDEDGMFVSVNFAAIVDQASEVRRSLT